MILIILINPGYSQQFVDFNQGEIKEESYYAVIPYNNVGSLIIVDTEINWKKYKFMVDTGASATLAQNVYNNLNIQAVCEEKINDSNGKTDRGV